MNLTLLIVLIIALLIIGFLVYQFILKEEKPPTTPTGSTGTIQKSGPPAFPEGQGSSGSSILPKR